MALEAAHKAVRLTGEVQESAFLRRHIGGPNMKDGEERGGGSKVQADETREGGGGEREHGGGLSNYAFFISSFFATRASASDAELSTLAPLPSQCR